METKITKEFNRCDHKQYVMFILETKSIFKFGCDCGDFLFRRLKKNGKNADIRIKAEPCKHLKDILKLYELSGYKIKERKPMEGPDKPSAALRIELEIRSHGICEQCGEDEAEDIHRIVRGNAGGKYIIENCLFVSENCHKEIHRGEFK